MEVFNIGGMGLTSVTFINHHRIYYTYPYVYGYNIVWANMIQNMINICCDEINNNTI